MHDTSGYHFFGNFWLSPPEHALHPHALRRLRQLEPHLRQLESATSPGCQPQQDIVFNLPEAFREFQELESRSWAYPRRKDELVPPSGSLKWPIAHHLHNPSFQTLTPHEGETEDATSSCVWMIIANNFAPGKTLVFDHLSRRESTDGLQLYPQSILDVHENWLSRIRLNMAAKVEVVYGKKVRDRMSQIYDLEPLQLWGKYQSIVLHLEWLPSANGCEKSLARLIIPAYHPQVFLSPGAARYGVQQDTILRIAHSLAELPYNDGFYEKFNTTLINKSGVRPHHYNTSKELAAIAEEELNKNIAAMTKPGKLRPISRVQLPLNRAEIERFNMTKVSQKYRMDPTKQSVILVRCKACGLPDKDYQPLWCIRSGKYVARRKRCTDEKCDGRLTIPQDSLLEYVAYCGLPASMDTSIHRSPKYKKRLEETSKSPTLPSTPPEFTPACSVSSKGYNAREARQFGQLGEKGPFKYWHGRKPVMNKMGRVRIWVLHGAQSAAMTIKRLDFSTYGLYLLKSEIRILDFNSRGISLVSPEGKELWHASLDQLRTRKNGEDLLKQHRHELEQQRHL